jgi:septal ring factor EnvC (AmiA/AmiB activator)
MTGIEIVGAIAAAIASMVAGWLGYRQHKITKSLEEKHEENTQERSFVKDLLDRVDKLDTRQDQLQDRLIQTINKSDEDRRKLAIEYDQRIEQIRKEMRRLIDDAQFELATWRDKYFTLIEEYQKLKIEYATLDVKFDKLDKEYQELRVLYRRRVGDATPDVPRIERRIEDTP